MIYARNFLFDEDLLGLHSRMPFDNVKGMIDRLDDLNFCKLSKNSALNVWAHHLENFIEEQATIINYFIGKGVSPLKLLLVDFNSDSSFRSEQLHDLMGKYGRL
jgi:hypothetical protein